MALRTSYRRVAIELPVCSVTAEEYKDGLLHEYYVILGSCDTPAWTYPLCELDSHTSQNKREDSKHTQINIAVPSNVTFNFQHVICPSGHGTHSFLACDVNSKCYADDSVNYGRTRDSWDVPTKASCRAPLSSLPPAFECTYGQYRVPYSLVCDHRRDCHDNSDEDFCVFPLCPAEAPLQCENKKVLLYSA